ncbi:unnamed protein product [Amoebophrya sp. A120]|nr:unnamed protein product [Amoebophrya sp. A120]|eukprot:GSA120T00008173001.1
MLSNYGGFKQPQQAAAPPAFKVGDKVVRASNLVQHGGCGGSSSWYHPPIPPTGAGPHVEALCVVSEVKIPTRPGCATYFKIERMFPASDAIKPEVGAFEARELRHATADELARAGAAKCAAFGEPRQEREGTVGFLRQIACTTKLLIHGYGDWWPARPMPADSQTSAYFTCFSRIEGGGQQERENRNSPDTSVVRFIPNHCMFPCPVLKLQAGCGVSDFRRFVPLPPGRTSNQIKHEIKNASSSSKSTGATGSKKDKEESSKSSSGAKKGDAGKINKDVDLILKKIIPINDQRSYDLRQEVEIDASHLCVARVTYPHMRPTFQVDDQRTYGPALKTEKADLKAFMAELKDDCGKIQQDLAPNASPALTCGILAFSNFLSTGSTIASKSLSSTSSSSAAGADFRSEKNGVEFTTLECGSGTQSPKLADLEPTLPQYRFAAPDPYSDLQDLEDERWAVAQNFHTFDNRLMKNFSTTLNLCPASVVVTLDKTERTEELRLLGICDQFNRLIGDCFSVADELRLRVRIFPDHHSSRQNTIKGIPRVSEKLMADRYFHPVERATEDAAATGSFGHDLQGALLQDDQKQIQNSDDANVDDDNEDILEDASSTSSVQESKFDTSFDLKSNDEDALHAQPKKWTKAPEKQLRDWQRRALTWMVDQERNPKSVSVLQRKMMDLGEAMLGINSDAKLLENAIGVEFEVEYKYNLRGGVLADKVGFGKTATTLALMAAQHDFFAVKKNAKAKPKLPEQDAGSFYDLSSTTLILVPSQLVDQWEAEVKKFGEDYGWKVLTIKTITKLAQKTARELAAFDLVACTYRVLYSKDYLLRVQDYLDADPEKEVGKEVQKVSANKPYPVQTLKRVTAKLIEDWDRSDADYKAARAPYFDTRILKNSPALYAGDKRCSKTTMNSKSKTSLDLPFPLLEQCHWGRLVLDEFHEAEALSGRTNVLMFLRSSCRWGLTGTPCVQSAESVRTMGGLFGMDLATTGADAEWFAPTGPQPPPVRFKGTEKIDNDHKPGNPNKILRAPCVSSVVVQNCKNFLSTLFRQNAKCDDVENIRVVSREIAVAQTHAERLLYEKEKQDLEDEHSSGPDLFDFAAKDIDEEKLARDAFTQLIKLCSHHAADEAEGTAADAMKTRLKKALAELKSEALQVRDHFARVEVCRRLLIFCQQRRALRIGTIGASKAVQTTFSKCAALSSSSSSSAMAAARTGVLPTRLVSTTAASSLFTCSADPPAKVDEVEGRGEMLMSLFPLTEEQLQACRASAAQLKSQLTGASAGVLLLDGNGVEDVEMMEHNEEFLPHGSSRSYNMAKSASTFEDGAQEDRVSEDDDALGVGEERPQPHNMIADEIFPAAVNEAADERDREVIVEETITTTDNYISDPVKKVDLIPSCYKPRETATAGTQTTVCTLPSFIPKVKASAEASAVAKAKMTAAAAGSNSISTAMKKPASTASATTSAKAKQQNGKAKAAASASAKAKAQAQHQLQPMKRATASNAAAAPPVEIPGGVGETDDEPAAKKAKASSSSSRSAPTSSASTAAFARNPPPAAPAGEQQKAELAGNKIEEREIPANELFDQIYPPFGTAVLDASYADMTQQIQTFCEEAFKMVNTMSATSNCGSSASSQVYQNQFNVLLHLQEKTAHTDPMQLVDTAFGRKRGDEGFQNTEVGKWYTFFRDSTKTAVDAIERTLKTEQLAFHNRKQEFLAEQRRKKRAEVDELLLTKQEKDEMKNANEGKKLELNEHQTRTSCDVEHAKAGVELDSQEAPAAKAVAVSSANLILRGPSPQKANVGGAAACSPPLFDLGDKSSRDLANKAPALLAQENQPEFVATAASSGGAEQTLLGAHSQEKRKTNAKAKDEDDEDQRPSLFFSSGGIAVTAKPAWAAKVGYYFNKILLPEVSNALARYHDKIKAANFLRTASYLFSYHANAPGCACCGKRQSEGLSALGITRGGHVLCEDCATGKKCPVSRAKIPAWEPPHFYLVPSPEQGGASKVGATSSSSSSFNLVVPPNSYDHFGSKIQRICEVLKQIKKDDPGSKAIVFCQWTDLMKKIDAAFKVYQFKSRMLNKANANTQNKVVRCFQKDKADEYGESPEILLMSLENKASGTTLTRARYILFVHPVLAKSAAESMAIEQQALGRVRRLGQTASAVSVYRFYACGTVEEKLHKKRLKQLQKQVAEVGDAKQQGRLASSDVQPMDVEG